MPGGNVFNGVGLLSDEEIRNAILIPEKSATAPIGDYSLGESVFYKTFGAAGYPMDDQGSVRTSKTDIDTAHQTFYPNNIENTMMYERFWDGGLMNWTAWARHRHEVADINATGTLDATTFLRGDGSWAAVVGGLDYGFNVYRTTDQNLASGWNSPLFTSTESYNPDGAFEIANNFYRVPVDGLYLFGAVVGVLGISTACRTILGMGTNGASANYWLSEQWGNRAGTLSGVMVDWFVGGTTVQFSQYVNVTGGYTASNITKFFGGKIA